MSDYGGPTRIPADIDKPDRIVAGLTIRQAAILLSTAGILYAAWGIVHAFVPAMLFVVLSLPVAASSLVLALGQRDGVSLDRLLLAAIRQRLAPRYHVPTGDTTTPAAGTGPLVLPANDVDDRGVIDLGGQGVAVMAVASTVNFALRTPGEQQALVAGFARWLHSLTAPVQLLVRSERLDLSDQIAELRDRAPSLPHPLLEAAAREHADFLQQLAEGADLLCRQVLIVLREPVSPVPAATNLGARLRVVLGSGRSVVDPAARTAAADRLTRRLDETTDLLGVAGIVVTPLDASQTAAVLAAACNPETGLGPIRDLAPTNEVITTAPDNETRGWTMTSDEGEVDEWAA